MISPMKKGLLPITTFVRSDLAIDMGQLTAKQRRNSTSQMLNELISWGLQPREQHLRHYP